MISAKAIAAIEKLFDDSLQANSIASPEDACVVTTLANVGQPDKAEKHQLVLITISSYSFRIVTLFDFNENAETAAHLAKVLHRTDKLLSGQALFDAYSEFINMVCGKVNREICTAVPHLGMSTPFALESACAQYLSTLKPTHIHPIEATVNQSVRFRITVCICAANDANLDFQIIHSAQHNTPTGEMELF